MGVAGWFAVVHTCIHSLTHASTSLCAHARTRARTHARAHARTHCHTHTRTHTHTHPHAHTHTHTHAHTHTRTHTPQVLQLVIDSPNLDGAAFAARLAELLRGSPTLLAPLRLVSVSLVKAASVASVSDVQAGSSMNITAGVLSALGLRARNARSLHACGRGGCTPWAHAWPFTDV